MVFSLQILATIFLLLVSSLGPGLLVVRYFRWRPMETLVGAVAASLLFQYLAAFALYALDRDPSLSYLVSGISGASLVLCHRDLRRLWNHSGARRAMLAQLALFGWFLLLAMLMRNYSGGRWCCDWLEHYERARFFTDHLPLSTTFLEGIYELPARPPMMNLLAGHFMHQAGKGFEVFQVTFVWLNVLAFLPCCLLARHLAPRARSHFWLLAGVLALNPMFVQNSLFTWTKLFAAFYVLAALAFYLAAWRRNDGPRMVVAFCCIACAMIVHYSAVPVLLFMGAHYLYVILSRPRWKIVEFVVAFTSSVAIIMTWLGWSLANLGWELTFNSNTTSQGFKGHTPAENLTKIGMNIWNTLVPYPLRGAYADDPVIATRLPAQGAALFRDKIFTLYQMELFPMFGLGCLGLVLWFTYKNLILGRNEPSPLWRYRIFWITMLLVVTPLGILVHGDLDFLGVAHICLQPLVMIGLTLAACNLTNVTLGVRLAALVGLAADAALGVLLHIHMMKVAVFKEVPLYSNGNLVGYAVDPPYNMLAIGEWMRKGAARLTFLADHFAAISGLIEAVIVLVMLGILLGMGITLTRFRAPPRRPKA